MHWYAEPVEVPGFPRVKASTIYYKRWKTTASPKTGPERPRDRYSMSQWAVMLSNNHDQAACRCKPCWCSITRHNQRSNLMLMLLILEDNLVGDFGDRHRDEGDQANLQDAL